MSKTVQKIKDKDKEILNYFRKEIAKGLDIEKYVDDDNNDNVHFMGTMRYDGQDMNKI